MTPPDSTTSEPARDHGHDQNAGEAHDHLVDDDFGCATPAETLEATRSGAACAWWQLTGFLSVAGSDTITFLDAIASQDIAAIPGGQGRHSLFLTNKARIIAPVLVWRVADDHVLIELDPRLVESLQGHLRRYKLRAKVEITHVDLGCTTLVGHGAEALAVRLADELGAAPPAGTDAVVELPVPDDTPIDDPFEPGGWYTSPAWGLPARTFIGSLAATHAVVSRLEADELAPMADPETLDALRITAGVPALSDLLVDYMPAEVGGVDVGVSLTKGCYLGQEPVARLHWRGKANRALRQVTLDGALDDDLEIDELTLVAGDVDEAGGASGNGKSLGLVTSWARHPDGHHVGLAVARRELDATSSLKIAGTDVSVHLVGSANDE